MSLILKVNSIDRSHQVDWRSLEKVEVLTKEPDTLKFAVKNYGTKTYRPALGDTVEFFQDATKIFNGVVVEFNETIFGANLKEFTVQCKDLTHTLDRTLVVKTYTNQTANAIIADIIANFTSVFTANHVNASVLIDKIVFNYVPVSQALQKLADQIEYDWYVDYDADIHFFSEEQNTAPFNLDETSGNFVWNSLRIAENIHQLRNHIFLRGGDIEGTQRNETIVADGQQKVFLAEKGLVNLTIKKASVTQTIGRDGVDDPLSKDVLYNTNQGIIRFREDNKPTSLQTVFWEGIPIFPLIKEVTDEASISLFGTFQYVIVDKTVKSTAQAKQKLAAELKRYGDQIRESSFRTYKDGLRTGQQITINLPSRNTNQKFLINRIVAHARKPDALEYEVFLLASEQVTMIDVLKRLTTLDKQEQIEVRADEVLDRIRTVSEIINVQEQAVTSDDHNRQLETVNSNENAITQPLNYPVIFVYGAYVPTIAFNGADTKRVFFLNGSPLG